MRLLATISGKPVWQRRDIGINTSQEGQSDLRASFGLSNSTNIITLRIEWPSGAVQELRDVASNQFLTITEPGQLKASVANGKFELSLHGGIGISYEVQASGDLTTWTSVARTATTNMAMSVLSVDVTQERQNYFRAVRQ